MIKIRKRSKHIEAVSIIILLSFFILSNAQAKPSVDLGYTSGKACEQVTIAITLKNEPGVEIAATSNDIGYDSSYLTPKQCILGPAGEEASKTLASNIVEPGLYRVGILSLSNLNPIPNGILAYITFEISCGAPAGKYNLINNPSCSSPGGDPIVADGKNGSIEVIGAGTTSSTTTTPIPPPSSSTTTNLITSTTTIVSTTTITSTTTLSSSTTTAVPPPITTSTSSSTTTSISLLWPVAYEGMWGEKRDEKLVLMRVFRDEVLFNMDIGREYIFTLYDNSLEIVLLLILEPSLTVGTAEVLNELIPCMESLLYSDEMKVSQDTIDNVMSLFDQFETQASPKLKAAINKFKEDITTGEVLEKLEFIEIEK